MSNIKYIEKDLTKIANIEKVLLEIVSPKEEDFLYLNKIANEIESNMFFIGNIEEVENIATIKKVFIFLEKYPDQFFNFKYPVFEAFVSLEKLYRAYIKGNDKSIEKNREILLEKIKNIVAELDRLNQNKEYYYMKFNLDVNTPYFCLSRRSILMALKEYGKAYNYTPTSLDDDRYDYFIVDYKIEKGIDVKALLEKLKASDEGILKYNLHKIDVNKNIYNIKIYLNKVTEEVINNIKSVFDDKYLLDMLEYENMLDMYIDGKNQLDLFVKIFNLKDENIYAVLIKNIDNRETRFFAINGINKNNVAQIKKIIQFVLTDKNIVDILCTENTDFSGIQFLEYLKANNNIEYRKIN